MASSSIEATLGRISLRIASTLEIGEVLAEITRGLVGELDAALARIWLLRPGDRCARCQMAPECPDQSRCLHLVASAGLSDRVDGSYQRVPFGVRKVGEIFATNKPLVTNDLPGEPRVVNKEWVQQEGLVSFAGYPLGFRDDVFGVLAMFARRSLTVAEFDRLGIFAAQASVAIKNARLFDEVSHLSHRLAAENAYLKDELRADQAAGIVGDSLAIARVLREVDRVAPTLATVLIHGETGTGKELVARAIHERSPRRGQALITVNCAAMSPTLIESELFGHEKGAFTGALQRRAGRFELAQKGTLFLDEVGELPLDVQAKLLRVLQERELERVGGA
jgi:transcriptional regulator with GAF, ATPase, and Fis domain